MFNHDRVKLCSIGYGGNSIEYGNGCHGSWYLHSPEDIAKHYGDKMDEGVLLIDKRPALDVNTMYAFASPMVNVDMKDGEADPFPKRHNSDSIMVNALKEHSAYGALIQAAEIAEEVAPDVPGPLDYVPVNYYVNWWKDRGAIVYRFDGEAFVRQS